MIIGVKKLRCFLWVLHICRRRLLTGRAVPFPAARAFATFFGYFVKYFFLSATSPNQDAPFFRFPDFCKI